MTDRELVAIDAVWDERRRLRAESGRLQAEGDGIRSTLPQKRLKPPVCVSTQPLYTHSVYTIPMAQDLTCGHGADLYDCRRGLHGPVTPHAPRPHDPNNCPEHSYHCEHCGKGSNSWSYICRCRDDAATVAERALGM